MNFLCPNHRQQFALLPQSERENLWLFWMDSAATTGAQSQAREAILLAGSAFDLACLSVQSHKEVMKTELTLSAILVSRLLMDYGDLLAAEEILSKAVDTLQQTRLTRGEEGRRLLECIDVLLDRSKQAEYFANHLNWPKFPFVVENSTTPWVVH